MTITSCSTYSNKFNCKEAKGLGCTMLHQIDQQIDSGQIEEVYKQNNQKNCKGKKKSNLNNQDYLLQSKQLNKAAILPPVTKAKVEDNNVYF